MRYLQTYRAIGDAQATKMRPWTQGMQSYSYRVTCGAGLTGNCGAAAPQQCQAAQKYQAHPQIQKADQRCRYLFASLNRQRWTESAGALAEISLLNVSVNVNGRWHSCKTLALSVDGIADHPALKVLGSTWIIGIGIARHLPNSQ